MRSHFEQGPKHKYVGLMQFLYEARALRKEADPHTARNAVGAIRTKYLESGAALSLWSALPTERTRALDCSLLYWY